MKTEILKIDCLKPEMNKIRYAAEVLKNGGLVVFPTETVYGLGANALDSKAVSAIFEAKGRPSDNPLIVHVSSKEQIAELTVGSQTAKVELVMNKFWPGPLTIVLNKAECIPSIITAGLSTVAVRMPDHLVALSLIATAGVPLAAPSANRSGKPSPTRVEHVIQDLNGRVDIIIDSGICSVGIESTVLDMTSDRPMILRPGGVTLEELRGTLGEVFVDPGIELGNDIAAKSPGMKYRHYSPKAELFVVSGKLENIIAKIYQLAEKNVAEGVKTAILATDETKSEYDKLLALNNAENLISIVSSGGRMEKEKIAENLYDKFRYFDKIGVEVIIAEGIDEIGVGMAIMNRLNKASGCNQIIV